MIRAVPSSSSASSMSIITSFRTQLFGAGIEPAAGIDERKHQQAPLLPVHYNDIKYQREQAEKLDLLLKKVTAMESRQGAIHETVVESQSMISDINVKVEDTQRSMKQVLGKLDKILRQLSLRQVFYVLVTGIGILLMLYIVMKIVF